MLERKSRKRDQEIDVNEECDLQNWAQYFGVGEETVKEAVVQVGPRVRDVEKALCG